jgi:hypothetical protein
LLDLLEALLDLLLDPLDEDLAFLAPVLLDSVELLLSDLAMIFLPI